MGAHSLLLICRRRRHHRPWRYPHAVHRLALLRLCQGHQAASLLLLLCQPALRSCQVRRPACRLRHRLQEWLGLRPLSKRACCLRPRCPAPLLLVLLLACLLRQRGPVYPLLLPLLVRVARCRHRRQWQQQGQEQRDLPCRRHPAPFLPLLHLVLLLLVVA